MNINQMFPGAYLKASDFTQPVQLQMASIAIETVGQGQQAEQKPVLYFSGVQQGIVLNKTNANVIADAYGQDTNAWMGQWVVIQSERVQFGDKMVSGIRFKIPQQAAPAPQGLPQGGGMPWDQ